MARVSSRIQAAAEPDGEPDEPDEPAGEPCEPPGWPGDPECDQDDREPPGDPRGCGDRDGGDGGGDRDGGDGGGGEGRTDNRETPHCDTAAKPPHSPAEAESRNDALAVVEPVYGVGNAGEEAKRGVDLDDLFASVTVTDNGRLVPKV